MRLIQHGFRHAWGKPQDDPGLENGRNQPNSTVPIVIVIVIVIVTQSTSSISTRQESTKLYSEALFVSKTSSSECFVRRRAVGGVGYSSSWISVRWIWVSSMLFGDTEFNNTKSERHRMIKTQSKQPQVYGRVDQVDMGRINILFACGQQY